MAPETSGITSIELLLDDDAEARIRAEWEALAAAGMSSMAGHEAASNRPHVTLLARSLPVPHPLRVGGVSLPLPIVLGAPLLFGEGDRRVLARSVVPSSGLLGLQRAVLTAAGNGDGSGGPDDGPGLARGDWSAHEHGLGHGHASGNGNDGQFFAPGRWTPHVTLARRIRLVDLPAALRLLGPEIEAHGVALRRWDAASATVSSVDIR
ncbi:hypothetical protein [Agrococcus sp. ProA11]|uniref:hypothetical protein n=1 Tax=Agrococcus chionoecetis TaxID=3153752 RepID=UPI00326121E8